MPLALIPYPIIDPVLVHLGPLPIRWYALSFIGALLAGWTGTRFLYGRPRFWGARPHPSVLAMDDLVVYMAAGIILGGRIGYILFYNLPFYLEHPLDMLQVWNGGMSFHGGLLGSILAMAVFALRNGVSVLGVTDAVAATVPIGIVCVRLANFIKPELWGRPTDVAWAMIFPGSDGLPRHPSQLYEAGLEGVALFVLLAIVIARGGLRRDGLITALFLMGYGAARIVCEFFREPDKQLGYLFHGATMGMLLSVPLILAGLALLVRALRRPRAADAIPAGAGGGGLNALARELHAMIAAEGPLSVERWMQLCLQHPLHGYYTTREMIGRGGDFITAPEIDQMFGELLGLWAAQVWMDIGAPAPLRLVELGPGRGTLMADALRATGIVPRFHETIHVDLVESSPRLAAAQRERLAGVAPPVAWHEAIEAVPEGPAIILANEFFDALPVRHYLRGPHGWHERVVGLDDDGRLAFGAAPRPIEIVAAAGAPGEVLEVGHAALRLMTALAGRLAAHGGALLVCDYGHTASGLGETLQAVRGHAYADPLADPGEADLTAHVDFAALARAAAAAGAAAHGPVAQGVFLQRLGIYARADVLRRGGGPRQAGAIDAALHRLTAPESSMATVFKVLAVTPEGAPVPPGFEE